MLNLKTMVKKGSLYVINFKAYETSYGSKALKIAKDAQDVAKKTGANIILCVPQSEIYRISSQVSIPVFSEHVDTITKGSSTGYISQDHIKAAGAVGSLLNHSEHRIRIDEIEASLAKLKELKLASIVCANDPTVGEALSLLKPDAIAVEPPELIGTGISVSTSKPEVVKDSVDYILRSNDTEIVLVGAGINNKRDVKKSIELGASGVLVASAVMKAKSPKKALMDLIL